MARWAPTIRSTRQTIRHSTYMVRCGLQPSQTAIKACRRLLERFMTIIGPDSANVERAFRLSFDMIRSETAIVYTPRACDRARAILLILTTSYLDAVEVALMMKNSHAEFSPRLSWSKSQWKIWRDDVKMPPRILLPLRVRCHFIYAKIFPFYLQNWFEEIEYLFGKYWIRCLLNDVPSLITDFDELHYLSILDFDTMSNAYRRSWLFAFDGDAIYYLYRRPGFYNTIQAPSAGLIHGQAKWSASHGRKQRASRY